MRTVCRFIALLFFFTLGHSAIAAGLSAPQGRVMLTVSGAIGSQNADGVAEFDREMLEALDWREIETYTSFTEGLQTFAGPTLASLLEVVEAQGAEIEATAINDYSTRIPVSHADEHSVILAMEWNGRAMRVRDKGPIWVVYPLSESRAAKQVFDSEMIWQLNRLTIQ